MDLRRGTGNIRFTRLICSDIREKGHKPQGKTPSDRSPLKITTQDRYPLGPSPISPKTKASWDTYWRIKIILLLPTNKSFFIVSNMYIFTLQRGWLFSGVLCPGWFCQEGLCLPPDTTDIQARAKVMPRFGSTCVIVSALVNFVRRVEIIDATEITDAGCKGRFG